jgi:hypothetical protein
VTSQEKAQRDRVARNFFDDGGRLHTIPRKFLRGSPTKRAPLARSAPRRGSVGLKLAKLLVVLDRLAWRSGGTFEV